MLCILIDKMQYIRKDTSDIFHKTIHLYCLFFSLSLSRGPINGSGNEDLYFMKASV